MKLKELRKENGLSQAKLAARLGVTQATLSGWENEKYDIDNETLKKISALLNVSIDYILGNTATEENTASAEALQFGSRIAEAREQNGISQKRLAEILKISPTRLNYWEKGKREPNIEMIKKIAQSLNVSLDYLLSSPTAPPTLLSAEEEKLLSLYNSADAYGKETILLFAEREATRK